jgi:hypothetical protein
MPVPACGSKCACEGASSEAETRSREEGTLERGGTRSREVLALERGRTRSKEVLALERGGTCSRGPLIGPLWWSAGATTAWAVLCVRV